MAIDYDRLEYCAARATAQDRELFDRKPERLVVQRGGPGKKPKLVYSSVAGEGPWLGRQRAADALGVSLASIASALDQGTTAKGRRLRTEM